MNVLDDIPISLTPEYVLQEQARRRQKSFSSALVSAATEAVAMGATLFVPAVVYDEFLVREVVREQVILSNMGTNGSLLGESATLAVGPKVDLLAPAERVMAAVYTIGPALERQVHELEAAGETLLAYMLDTVGVLALGAVGEALRDRVEKQALELGWGVGPALSPGSLVGWPLTGQRELCAVLPLERIGVYLNSYCVLEPHKSVSMVIGLGSGYASNHVGSVCRYCSLAGSCWRRRGDRT
jgi:uncharacterized membrane protein YgdD (TMEM256/DUF423 family)